MYPSNNGVSQAQLSESTPSTIVWVKKRSDMPANPSSDVEYWIDYNGLLEVDEITVPSGGLFIRGTQSDLTGIGSTTDNFTLFSGVGAGNVFIRNLYISVTGANSKVNDLSDSGGSAVEMLSVNFYGCSSLGELNGYRQLSLLNVGIFGGSPELTLSGSMNGIFIDTCLTRGLDAGFTGSLFKAGTALTLDSRFRSNMRVDLPSGASFCDFSTSNFLDSSLCQMNGGQYSRNGVVSSGDNQFFPNLDPEDLVCEWRDNNGLRNTHEGGRMTIGAESTTNITASGVFVDAAGAWIEDNLQHFSSPSNGQLKNDGKNPQEFLAIGTFYIDSGSNDVISVRLTKWDSSLSSFVEVYTANQQVLSIIGGRDVAVISVYYPLSLEVDDYVKIQVANQTNTTNITVETGSFLQVVRRA